MKRHKGQIAITTLYSHSNLYKSKMSAHPVCCSAPPPIYQSQIQEAFGIQVASYLSVCAMNM